MFIHLAELAGPPAPEVYRSPPRSGSIPCVPHTFWGATAFVSGIRRCASSSVTQVDRPHAAHRLAMGTTGDAGRSPLDLLDKLAGLLLRHGTILDGRGAALAAGLRQTGHIIYEFDSPFAPLKVSRYYKARPETY